MSPSGVMATYSQPGAAAAQALDDAGALFKVDIEVEEIDGLAAAPHLPNFLRQGAVFFPDAGKIRGLDFIAAAIRGRDRLDGNLGEAGVVQVQNILGKIKVFGCIGAADIIIKVGISAAAPASASWAARHRSFRSRQPFSASHR